MAFATRNFRHGRTTRVLADGSNLSGYLKEASISMTMDTPEATAFADSLKQWVTGLPDASATVSGMFDATETVGLDSVFAARFGKADTYLNLVVANEGLNVGRRSRAMRGILTSYNLQNTVADMVSLNMDMKLLGELFVMQNMNSFDNDPLSSAALVKSFDRQTIFGATSKYGATAFTGMLYVMLRAPTGSAATAITLTVDSDSLATPAVTDVPITALAGTQTNTTTVTIQPGEVGVAVTGQFAVGRYTTITTTGVHASVGNVPFYVGLIDPAISLLAG